MNSFLSISVISLTYSHVNCGPIKMQETRMKRAVFDIIPLAEDRVGVDSPGSTCQCSDGIFNCIRDDRLVCRRTLESLQNEQLVDRLERKTRRKNRRRLRHFFRKWLKEEIERDTRH
eukprot:GFUD01067814.1.p1 GENE.GFUD01067814.1~~GFUD01067814.1.p1  ORF type:complete len:126 (+),score=7.22 GFUD01067814.1:30-380(+)